MFSREGSLIRKKQRQWAQEKEEHEQEKDWFPFGENNSPGGGNPVRKHEAHDYSTIKGSVSVGEPSTTPEPLPCPAAGLSSLENISCKMKEKEADVPQTTSIIPQPYPMQIPPYAYPVSPEYWQGYSHHPFHLAYPPIPVPFHLIPPGAIPIPPPPMVCNSQEGAAPAHPIAPLYTPEQWKYIQSMQAQLYSESAIPFPSVLSKEQSSSNGSIAQTASDANKAKPLATAIVYPLPTPIVISEENKASSCQVSPILPVIVDFRQNTASSSESSKPDAHITAQVEEKWREQRKLEEKARVDEERIRQDRERQEQRRLQEEQKKLAAKREEKLNKEQIYQQVLDSIERARRDAELTKKAKIYKHVMEGQPEQEKVLLGEDGSRILKEVNAMERHRQLELEQLAHAHKSPSKDGENKHRRSASAHPDNRPIRPMNDQATSPFERGTGGRISLRRTPTQKRPSPVKRSNSAERNETFVIADDQRKNKSLNDGAALATRGSRIPRADKSLMRTPKTAADEIEVKLVDYPEPEPISATISTFPVSEGTSSPVEVRVITEPPYSNEPIDLQIPVEKLRNHPQPSVAGPWTSTPKTTQVSKHSANIRELPEQPARRAIQRPAALDPQSLLFSYTPIRRGNKMRMSTESSPNGALRGSVDSNDASSSGSASPSRAQSQRSPSIPSINVHDSDAENRCANNNQHDKLYSISQSPVASLGRARSGTNTPLFHKRLGELGVSKNTESQDSMSPETRRLAEQRFPSRSSMLNLAITDDSTKNRPASPLLDQFKSRAPQYRSFTLKKNSEKQAAILERLNAMRERLHEKDTLKDRPSNVPRFGSPNSTRGQRT